jgi:hypothetical protein
LEPHFVGPAANGPGLWLTRNRSASGRSGIK